MRRRPTRADLYEDGPPIRLTDLAVLSGFSPDKLLVEARAGDLEVWWARCGTRRMAMVERSEGRRYLSAIYHQRSA